MEGVVSEDGDLRAYIDLPFLNGVSIFPCAVSGSGVVLPVKGSIAHEMNATFGL